MVRKRLLMAVIAVFILAGCAQNQEAASDGAMGVSSVESEVSSDEEEGSGYQQISQEEAMKMMEEEDDYLILDVRTPEEFAEGHIPDAVNIPNETIGSDVSDVLKDKDQILLIYCRSGNRSKQASSKLAMMGYTNIYEFGGINTWPGEIVTE